MNYRYRAVEPFWKHFHRLNDAQKESARQTWKIFRKNPFDPRLRTHKIHKLSSLYGKSSTRRTSQEICASHFTLKGIGLFQWT